MQALEKIEELQQENTVLKTAGMTTTGGASDVEEKMKQVKKAYEDIITNKDKEHQKLLEDVDVLLADQETQLAKLKKERDVLREQVEALK